MPGQHRRRRGGGQQGSWTVQHICSQARPTPPPKGGRAPGKLDGPAHLFTGPANGASKGTRGTQGTRRPAVVGHGHRQHCLRKERKHPGAPPTRSPHALARLAQTAPDGREAPGDRDGPAPLFAGPPNTAAEGGEGTREAGRSSTSVHRPGQQRVEGDPGHTGNSTTGRGWSWASPTLPPKGAEAPRSPPTRSPHALARLAQTAPDGREAPGDRDGPAPLFAGPANTAAEGGKGSREAGRSSTSVHRPGQHRLEFSAARGAWAGLALVAAFESTVTYRAP